MADKWLLANKGKGFGPFSTSQIQQMVEAGVIDPDDLVWREGGSESIPASTVGNGPPPLPARASRPSPPPLPVPSTPASSSHPSRLGLWLSLSAVLLAMLGGGGWFAYDRGWLPVKMATIPANPTSASVASNSARTLDGDSETGSPTPTPQAVPIREQPVETPMLPANTTLPVKTFSLTFDGDVALLATKEIRLTDGIDGKAAEFTGNRSIQVPCTLPSGNAPRTLSAWIKNQGPSEARNAHAIAYGTNESSKRAFGIYHANGKWGIYGWGNQQLTEAVVDSDWHHHCLTYDGTTIVYWMDGRSVVRVEKTLDTTDGPLSLGSDASGSKYFSFTGLIGHVAVYDVALTQQQIALLANGRPR